MKTLLLSFTAAAIASFAFGVAALNGASVVEFSARTETNVVEGYHLHWIQIAIAPPSDQPIRVGLRVTGGAATPDEDFRIYQASGQDVPAKQGWVQFALQLTDDGIPEPDETINLELEVLSGDAVLGARRQLTLNLRNARPGIYVEGAQLGVPLLTFMGTSLLEIHRTGDRHEAADLEVAFVAGADFPHLDADLGRPAEPGRDFVPATNGVHFAAGESTRSIPLSFIDNEEDFYRTLTVRFSVQTPGVTLEHEDVLALRIKRNFLPTTLDVTRPSHVAPLFVLNQIEPYRHREIPLHDGRKLLVGAFTHFNGIPRPGLARLDANDELDEAFNPPADLKVRKSSWPLLKAEQWVVPLRSGGVTVPDAAGRLVRLHPDGSHDATFAPPFSDGFDRTVEAPDGTLWCIRGATVLHLASNGALVRSYAFPRLAGDERVEEVVAILPDGRLLLREWMPTGDGGNVSILQRWHPDGTLDASFNAIPAFAGGTLLNDGRLVGLSGRPSDTTVALYSSDGSRDSDFQPVMLGSPALDGHPGEVIQEGNALRGFRVFLTSINGVAVPGPYFHLHLENPPVTALQLSAHTDGRSSFWFEEADPSPIRVTFHRLGKNNNPATVHYTTRDVTATAGKDYIAKSGIVTFAPLEVEKVVEIPILADTEEEFDETLEVVVTAAEGFEELPVPMRLTILGKGPPPRLEHVKRLRDGRVILGGSALQDTTRLEFSTDLKAWHPLNNLQFGRGIDRSLVWLDASATNAPTRYYRAVAVEQ